MKPCPFCDHRGQLLLETPLCVAVLDAFPASPGHALVLPRRHVASYFDLGAEEKAGVWKLVDDVRDRLAERHHPDGFNVGLNDGAAAGQTVFHCHVHVIPRYVGDAADPRGGVRHAVPGKGYYQA